MNIQLSHPWEYHVANGVGILNNPWGARWNETPRDYELSVGHNVNLDAFEFDWNFSEYDFDPAVIVAYPQVYWGISDVAFSEAIPYPEFLEDINGETDHDVYIHTAIALAPRQGALNNYAIESFRFSGLPRKGGDLSTTTHEIMLWLHRPDSASIGFGGVVESEIYFDEAGPFTAFRKRDNSKYLAFIYAGDMGGSDLSTINWSAVLRKAGNIFETHVMLEAYDPADKFYSIEAGPEIWPSSQGTVEVSHGIERRPANRNTDSDFDTPFMPPSESGRDTDWMKLQALVFQMECSRSEGRTTDARVFHGALDTLLASYYDRYLK